MLFLFQILKISITCLFVRSIFNSITETLPILNMSSINSYAKLSTLIFPSPFLASSAGRNLLQAMPSFPRLSLLSWYLPRVWHPDILETAYMTFTQLPLLKCYTNTYYLWEVNHKNFVWLYNVGLARWFVGNGNWLPSLIWDSHGRRTDSLKLSTDLHTSYCMWAHTNKCKTYSDCIYTE